MNSKQSQRLQRLGFFIVDTMRDGSLYACYNDAARFDYDAFTGDIIKEVDHICAPQYAAIRGQADMEREILRRDIKIVELCLLLEFERAKAEAFEKMERAFDKLRDDMTVEGLFTMTREVKVIVYEIEGRVRDGMIIPLQALEKSRDERIASFEGWAQRNYGL